MRRDLGTRACDGGYILVAVLGVMLLLTGFIASGSLLVRSALDTARVGDVDAAMSGLAQAGLELTAYQLFIIKAAPAAIEGRRVKLDDGMVMPELSDEGGKADLNDSDPKLLTAIFLNAGLEPRTADALVRHIVEMRGPDRASPVAPSIGPSQSAASAGAPVPTRTQWRGIQSIDHLRDFPDLTGSDWRAIQPMLTVFNPGGKINILSASREMLTALPGLSSADVTVILARRNGETARKDIESLLSTHQETTPYTKTTFGPAFSVRIDASSAKGRSTAIHAVIAASKSRNDPYYVLDWRE